MAIDPPPAPPKELRQLEELIAHCRKRYARAEEKCSAAVKEERDASAALFEAKQRLDAWREANPEPQMQLI